MRNISLVCRSVWKSALLISAFSFLLNFSANAQDLLEGRKIFRDKCSSCHSLDRDNVGPALQPIVAVKSEAFLIKWINNAPAFTASGDPEAVEASKFNPSKEMTAFPSLTEDQIKNILAYVKEGEPKKEAAAGGAAESEISGLSIAGIVAVILGAILVLVMLSRAIKMLERLILQKQGIEIIEVEKVPVAVVARKMFKNKKFVFFVVLCLLMVLGSFGWMTMWNTGVHTGYQPVQPIKFSHELHAGINQIDCQYCHSGAFKSKNATIPSLNVCMTCHKQVQATEKYDGEISPEIQKIYAAMGYDPSKPDAPLDPAKQRPVEWVRIHNLPDFAYFNHSQHTVVGEEAIRKEAGLKPNEPICFACHGPIDTMEEVYQYSPLTMKWCINCHRDAQINTKENAFYEKVIAAHEQIKKGQKITPALLGGLECGKCHY